MVFFIIENLINIKNLMMESTYISMENQYNINGRYET
jgi:hypothetical protein